MAEKFGCYDHIFEVPKRTRMPSVVPRHIHRELRRMAREVPPGLRLCWNMEAAELQWMTSPDQEGESNIHATFPIHRVGKPGVSAGDEIRHDYHKRCVPMKLKKRHAAWSQKQYHDETQEKWRSIEDDMWNDDVDYQRYLEERRHMSRGFQRSHLIDKNPLSP